jgi:diguanylate cyclase (GGDEF)-like protein
MHDSGRNPISTRGRSAFDRRNPLNWLIFGGVLLIAFIVIGTATTVLSFRERALGNSERELENTVLLLARHFDRELHSFEAAQRDVVHRVELLGIASPEAFKRQMSGEEFHTNLQVAVGASSDIAGIDVFDASGQLINSSQTWPVPDISIADRSYFKEFATDNWSPAVLLTLVNSHFMGGWTTVVARKVVGPNGQFLGLVSRGISPASLEKFFESLALGKGSAITLLHRDGTMLARYPHVEAMIGRNFKMAAAPQVLSKANYGTVRLISPVDGEDRLASIRALSEFPLSIIATTTVSTALADWRAQTRFLIVAAGLSALVIAFTLLLIVRRLSKQHKASERRLALGKKRLDTALNNMSQGLCMFDKDKRLVLCNELYAKMYNLPAELLQPGALHSDIIAHRVRSGILKGSHGDVAVRDHLSVLSALSPVKRSVRVEDHTDGTQIRVVREPMEGGGWVATHEDITERKLSSERIAHLAHFDALTDLPNRVLFREHLERELNRIDPADQLAVLFLDVDEFKSVNDSLGHQVGDELLRSIAASLSACLKETDFIARLGGDEFAIVLTAVKCTEDVTNLVTRIYDAIRAPYECLGHRLTTDASIGIALAPKDGAHLDRILQNADLAMYSAKSDGRRTYRFFEPDMEMRVKARRVLEMDLRQAIVDGGFEVYYQPVVDLCNNQISGCEALLRWHHAERGMISPAEFIPVAEQTGLIDQLGEWVLTTACTEAATWPDHIKLAVNVSPVQFKSDTMALRVVAALAASGLAASRLELEITEAVLIRDDDAALAILHQLRAIGVRIALDDFGTGYSSLSYLHRFPFDKIKIDRSFVSDIAEDEGSSSIVQAVINIASSRNMTTTAEGVEMEQQKEILSSLGCTEMQGYLFSRALPVADIRMLLSRTNKVAAA